MDLQRWFLLALVLLGFILCIESIDCNEIRKNGCAVTGVYGTVLDLECFVAVNHETHPVINVNSSLEPTNEENLNKNSSNFDITDEDINYIGDNSSNISISNETVYEHDEENNSPKNNTVNFSSIVEYQLALPRIPRHNYTFTNFCQEHAYSQSQEKQLWYNISKINLSIFSDIPSLDLSIFPSVRTVALHTNAHFINCVLNAENVSELYLTSSCLGDNLSFISNFTGLTQLKLSKNSVQSIIHLNISSTLVLLDLSRNMISDISTIALPDSLHVLNVSFNEITNISDTFKSNLVIFDITNNRLSEIPMLQMKNLEELYMSHNNISSIEEGKFKNMTALVVLDLMSNRLRVIDDNAFSGLNRLQRLDLSNNQIATLAPSIFQDLLNLVSLNLSGNIHVGNSHDNDDASFLFGISRRLQLVDFSRTNLTRIPSTLTRSVRSLQLSKNIIPIIQCGDLESFPLIQRLDISSNHLKDIEEDALGRLDFLSDLIIAYNLLNTTPKSLPDQLHLLDLRHNSIKMLRNTDFLGLMQLRVLILSWNNISLIEDGAFNQLISLEELHLSHNPIKSLTRTSFLGPRKLKIMVLVSLTKLIKLQEQLSFPAPESAHLEVLNIESSPVLAAQLIDDVAALTMFHELYELNLNHCNISLLRNDLPKYLPRLHKLSLVGNVLNCTNIIWLVKWLEELNITKQDTLNTHSNQNKMDAVYLQEKKPVINNDDTNDNVICETPDSLAGRKVISLTEEDFPESKSTHLRDFTVPHHSVTTVYAELKNLSAQTNNKQSSAVNNTIGISLSDERKNLSNNLGFLKNPFTNSKTSLATVKNTAPNTLTDTSTIKIKKQVSERYKTMSMVENKWKYLRNDNKHSTFSSEPDVILLNGSSSIMKETDNHLNDSINSDAYLAHEVPPSSHPGMFVFLLVVGVILLAASVMVFSHYSQRRRGRAYQQQQDIEVSELW